MLSQGMCEKYADILVNFALNNGKGIEKDDVVLVQVPECAKPMLEPLRLAVLRAGGHVISQFLADGISRSFYETATDEQLSFFPETYFKGLIDQIDHSIYIIAETDHHELAGIEPAKIMQRGRAFKPYKEWRIEKENRGAFSWTLALYGTDAMAAEAGMSVEEYWEQIIKACYLDAEDPIAEWKRITTEIERVRQALNALAIDKLHLESASTDLWIGIGSQREWLSGGGSNIPSFELFISPDWRMTNGTISFDQPLYQYGTLVNGILLEFTNGVVTKAKADQGQDVLEEMIKVENANKVGEFSLTDRRMSRITKFMAETLYDENYGGEYGNTHIALGSAYKESLRGDPAKLSEEEWAVIGFNESVVHTDMISTEDRVVTALLSDGSKKVIYQNGEFQV